MAISKSTAKVIGAHLAKELRKEFGENVESLTIGEWIGTEFEDISTEDYELLAKFVRAFLKVSDVYVSLDDWRVTDDGEVLTKEQAIETEGF